MIDLYPVVFEPIYKQMLWGTERWDITCRPKEMSIIKNGIWAGETLETYINKNPIATLGTDINSCEQFPLLIKLIHAKEALSIQVHPNDEYVKNIKTKEGNYGKNEAWYILSPPTKGYLIAGLKSNVTYEKLKLDSKSDIKDCLNYLHVTTGDIVNIPAGLVHALTPGAILIEIQQNSDITYRLYDYNRVDTNGNMRPLHINDALAVIDFGSTPTKAVDCINNSHFTIVKQSIKQALKLVSNKNAFSIITCIVGQIAIASNGFAVGLSATCSAFIPAQLGEYCIIPMIENSEFLLSEPKYPPLHNIN